MLQKCYDERQSSENLGKLIAKAGHNHTSFAEVVGITPSAISKLANPNRPFKPKSETLLNISEALGVEISDIVAYKQEGE